MSKKNPYLGAVLGFFVLGIFYSGGLKKGAIAFIGLCVLSTVLAYAAPAAAIISNLIGAYFGYAWANQHNNEIAGQS